MTKAILIETNGNSKIIHVNGLEDLNKAVGGVIEGLHLGNSQQFSYINEDGIALKLPRNDVATNLCTHFNVGLFPDDFIKGPMVIVGPIGPEGEDTDVSQEMIQYLNIKEES